MFRGNGCRTTTHELTQPAGRRDISYLRLSRTVVIVRTYPAIPAAPDSTITAPPAEGAPRELAGMERSGAGGRGAAHDKHNR